MKKLMIFLRDIFTIIIALYVMFSIIIQFFPYHYRMALHIAVTEILPGLKELIGG